MKTRLLKTIAFILALIFVASCHPKKNLGEALNIKNTTSERIYWWYSRDYTQHHFSDTILPSERPINIFSISDNNFTLASGVDPNWMEIYSQLPDGELSVYFFESYPENQEE